MGKDKDAIYRVRKPKVSLNLNDGKSNHLLLLKDMNFAFNQILKVREYGCKKYDRMNWKLSKGKDCQEKFLEDNLASIFRHYENILNGEMKDSESKQFHYAHIALRCMIALEYEDV